MEWLTARNSRSKGPNLDGLRGEPVLGELGLDQRQGQPGPDERDVAALAQQVRHGPDVVLVGVRQDDGLDLVQPVPDVLEVRQNKVDPGLVGLGEQYAAIHDQQPAAELEDGHVPADLAESAERYDSQPVRRERGRSGQVGVRMAHEAPPLARMEQLVAVNSIVLVEHIVLGEYSSGAGESYPGSLTPPAVRSSRSRSRSVSVAERSGPLTGPAGRPNIDRAAFVITSPWFRKIPA
jgi:hypothetical protein